MSQTMYCIFWEKHFTILQLPRLFSFISFLDAPSTSISSRCLLLTVFWMGSMRMSFFFCLVSVDEICGIWAQQWIFVLMEMILVSIVQTFCCFILLVIYINTFVWTYTVADFTLFLLFSCAQIFIYMQIGSRCSGNLDLDLELLR